MCFSYLWDYCIRCETRVVLQKQRVFPVMRKPLAGLTLLDDRNQWEQQIWHKAFHIYIGSITQLSKTCFFYSFCPVKKVTLYGKQEESHFTERPAYKSLRHKTEL